MKKEMLYGVPIFCILVFIAVYAITKPLPEGHKQEQTTTFETTTEIRTEIINELESYIHSEAEAANEAIKPTATEEPTTVEPTTEEETTPEIMEPFKAIDGIEMGAELQKQIYDLCGAYEIDFIFFMGWCYTESRCRWSIGAANDTGYMQIIPKWHEEAAKSMGIDIFSELGNCEYAMVLLNSFLSDEGGDMKRALQRYNTGSPDTNNGYAERVFKNVEKIREVYEQ